MNWPTYDEPRTDKEAEILADEIRRGLDELFESHLERDTDEMRDRARQQIRDLAMIERGQFGYGNTHDTVQSLHRLIRRRLVIELRMAELYYVAGETTCPVCGAELEQ